MKWCSGWTGCSEDSYCCKRKDEDEERQASTARPNKLFAAAHVRLQRARDTILDAGTVRPAIQSPSNLRPETMVFVIPRW